MERTMIPCGDWATMLPWSEVAEHGTGISVLAKKITI